MPKCDGDYREFKDVQHHADEVTYVSAGEGTTSQGEFWESLNTASMRKLPVLYRDRGQRLRHLGSGQVPDAGGNISRLVANFPNFHFEECDGTDFLQVLPPCAAPSSTSAPATARPWCTAMSSVPTRTRSPTTRSSTVPRASASRTPSAIPSPRLQKFLLAEGILDPASMQKLHREVDAEVQAAADAALDAPFPEPSSYVPPRLFGASEAHRQALRFGCRSPRAVDRTMADLINTCLRDEMQRDERVVIFGEDVADCSSDEYLEDKKLKGKGGVFKLTTGLQRQFGSDRVFNSPLAEANIVGRALGMAARGLKPVVEIQFFDYIWPAMHQLRNELPLIRWRSNDAFSCPAVVRVAIGGYLTGGAIYHSQCGESIFTHTPGMHVVFPSNALDAAGLLRTAIRCDDPVLFLEHKRLYREPFGRAPYPGPDYTIPFGKARIWKEGTDITVVTYGATVPRSLQAAQRLEREHGISVEVLDLRTLNPYDFEAIAASVGKTSRVLVVHEDMLSWGYGAEIAARIGSELFDKLDAPVQRIGAKDTFVAYQPHIGRRHSAPGRRHLRGHSEAACVLTKRPRPERRLWVRRDSGYTNPATAHLTPADVAIPDC